MKPPKDAGKHAPKDTAKGGKVIPIQEWLESFHGAADDLARGSLRFDPQAETARGAAGQGPGHEAGEPGAYIAILSPNNAVHLGLSAPPTHCKALAPPLLGLRNEQPVA